MERLLDQERQKDLSVREEEKAALDAFQQVAHLLLSSAFQSQRYFECFHLETLVLDHVCMPSIAAVWDAIIESGVYSAAVGISCVVLNASCHFSRHSARCAVYRR